MNLHIFYVKDLVVLSKDELLRIKNLGRKSIIEIDEFITKNGLSFGMDISKYELWDTEEILII